MPCASPEWQAIQKDWARLAEVGLKLELSANIAAHTKLIAQMLVFVTEAADHYRLTQDPQIGSFYLMDTAPVRLPALLETLGRMRAAGTGVLAARTLAPAQTNTLNVALAAIDDVLGQYGRNLAKTRRERRCRRNPRRIGKKLTSEVERLTSIVRNHPRAAVRHLRARLLCRGHGNDRHRLQADLRNAAADAAAADRPAHRCACAGR